MNNGKRDKLVEGVKWFCRASVTPRGLSGVERPLCPQLNKLCQGLGPLALFCSPSAFAWWLNASKFDLVMGKLFSFGTLGIMCNFKTRVWAHCNYFEIPSAKIHSKTFFFFFLVTPTLSLGLLPCSQVTNQVSLAFFRLSAIFAKRLNVCSW